MPTKTYPEAQNPLILNCHRLMEAFAKSNDERDFYLDRVEGFIVYVDLDKSNDDLTILEKEIVANIERYCLIPKFTFYETKKIMEGFVHEKVYDIDTKEKLIEIIQSKEARENFLEFVYDHHAEFEKWQQYYQERSRIRIIEWLRQQNFHFVFEEDIDLTKNLLEKVKQSLFESKVGKDIAAARKTLSTKAKTYYSNEALNPRPKRGRPPKQAAKTELEPQYTIDIFTTVPPTVRPFLFTPDVTLSTALTFSSKFDTEEAFLAGRHGAENKDNIDSTLKSLNEKLVALRNISSRWVQEEQQTIGKIPKPTKEELLEHEEEILKEFEIEDEVDQEVAEKKLKGHKVAKIQHASSEKKKEPAPKKAAPKKTESVKKEEPSKKKAAPKRIIKEPKKTASKAKETPAKKPVKRRLKKT